MVTLRPTTATIKIGVERALVYRANYFISVVCGIIPLIAQILFWTALYGGVAGDWRVSATQIAGYRLPDMITYFALVYVMQWGLTTTSVELQVRDDVMNGDLSFHLLRPVGYLLVQFTLAAARRVVTFALSLVCFVMLLVAIRAGIQAPAAWSQLPALVLAVITAYALAYLLSCLLGAVSFWTLEISTLSIFVRGMMLLLSGAVFPLDYIEGVVGSLLRYSPFAYLVFFPTQLYLRILDPATITVNLLIGGLWLMVLGVLTQKVWLAGMRRYSAFGG